MAPERARNIDNYFNKANVFIPVDPLNPNPFGNAGRNTVRSYAIYQTDLGLHKDFTLGGEAASWNFARSSSICSIRRTSRRRIPPSRAAPSGPSGAPSRHAIIQMALRLSF